MLPRVGGGGLRSHSGAQNSLKNNRKFRSETREGGGDLNMFGKCWKCREMLGNFESLGNFKRTFNRKFRKFWEFCEVLGMLASFRIAPLHPGSDLLACFACFACLLYLLCVLALVALIACFTLLVRCDCVVCFHRSACVDCLR